jgi:predicted ester cyclase
VGSSECVKDIRSAVAALNQGDVSGYLRHFGDPSPRWVDGIDEAIPLSDVAENLSQLLAAFEGLGLAEELLFGDDRYVCAHWRMTGRHVGEYFGTAPTGREVVVPLCEVYEFDAGRVSNTWTHGDPAELFRQIQGPAIADRSR